MEALRYECLKAGLCSRQSLSDSRLSAQSESRETLLGFNMVNYRACKNLWKACVEHHTFFRLERPIPPQKNFFAHYFTLGSKFRYWWDILFIFSFYKLQGKKRSCLLDPCLLMILDRCDQPACLNTVNSWGSCCEGRMQLCHKTASNYFQSACIKVSCPFNF